MVLTRNDIGQLLRTPVFEGGYSLAMIGLLYGLIRLRVRVERARQNELEVRVEEITREIRQSHQELWKMVNHYTFIDVSDEQRPLVVDALNGCSDYARLRGYDATLEIKADLPGRIGFRFVVSFAATESKAPFSVTQDVDDYIARLSRSDDLSNMPMVLDVVSHSRLVAALQTRFAFLRMKVDMLSAQNDFYKRLAEQWTRSLGHGSSVAPSFNLNITNWKGSNMRDKYSARNVQNLAQGKGSKAS